MIGVIDLLKLNYLEKIDINEEIEFPQEMLNNTDIVSLSKVKVVGNIKFDMDDNYLINLDVSGKMTLHDSLTYELIDYPFNINIEEKSFSSFQS